MTREYYQILGVSETANLEEIKKSYRKLAQKWHPDKWNTKSLAEREEANKKMQELNKAYEVLGDEDKRKRYDLGETNFSYDTSDNFDWQSYYDTERAKLNTEAEKIRFQLEALARRDVMNTIGFEMDTTEVYPRKLDSKLWSPYNKWGEKVLELEVLFTVDGRLDKVNSPLYKFQEEMITAIRKRKEELKKGINNPQVDKARITAIESINRELLSNNLKVNDLDTEYVNYQEKINTLTKVWEISSYRDKVKEYIRRKSEEKGDNDNLEDDEIAKLRKKFNQPQTTEKEWEKEKKTLLEEIRELKELANNQKGSQEKLTKKFHDLEELIKELSREIQELKAEIQELKQENPNSPNAVLYVKQKESELQSKESKLEQLLSVVNSHNDYKEQKNNNPFPILPIIGMFSLFALLVGLITYKRKRK